MAWKRRLIESMQIAELLVSLFTAAVVSSDCDKIIDVNSDGTSGIFTSPGWPAHYENNQQCIYKFIGRPNHKIQIEFERFSVKGVPPRCSHDYVDIYTQIRRPDESLLDAELHGRYCGHVLDDLPHLLISMYDVLILILNTDGSKTDQGFKGRFEFIDASKYTVGTPAGPHMCGQTIYSSELSTGYLLSPTYPGVYPDNIHCFYKLKGSPGQRIKFTFLDLDLYSGGDHCPFDYVRIYDGETKEAEEIGVYCGKHNNIDVYSTKEYLHIDFVTKSGRLEPTKRSYFSYWEIDEAREVQQKGFNASFEFSDRFVNLSFIHEGEHVKGTECDQRVFSRKESNGTITSPNYPRPYPLGVKCHYFVDGLVDRQNLEKVKLSFLDFDIPVTNRRCDNGRILAYTEGQSLAGINQRHERYNRVMCGNYTPPMLETSNPRLLLVFDATGATVPGRGFKALYQFVTDYAIPGIPVSEGACHFLYNSTRARQGSFNSPRHPSNYPHDTNCTYEFFGQPDDHIRFTFEFFAVENRLGECRTDYLEIFEVLPSNRRRRISKTCGDKTPGPVMAATSHVVAVFSSDRDHFDAGFRARYVFLSPSKEGERCSTEEIDKGGGGVLRAPNHPNKYHTNYCHEWHIRAQLPRARIMLVLESFDMEGSLKEDGHGCANAALKVFTDRSAVPQYEVCGKIINPDQIVTSQANDIRVQFISSDRAIGAKGFKITWTEIVPTSENNGQAECDKVHGYLCKETNYCIDKRLICNGNKNCGAEDESDEEQNCEKNYTDQGVLHVILGVVVALIVLVFIIVCILHRRRKQKKRRNRKEIEVRYVTRSAVANHSEDHYHNNHTHQFIEDNDYYGAGRTLLREKTEKVSIV